MKKLYRDGVLLKKTDIWAEGLDSWCNLESVAQFRWTICYGQHSSDEKSNESDAAKNEIMEVVLYNPTELCVTILNIFIQMCSYFPSKYANRVFFIKGTFLAKFEFRDETGAIIRPLSRIRKIISEPVVLYQLAQLLLTYEPSIVQRVIA